MTDHETTRATVLALRESYRESLDRFFVDTDGLIETCRSIAPGLGVYADAGATYAETTLIVTQVSAKIIADGVEKNPVLRAALLFDPMLLVQLATALTYYVVTPEEITT